MSPVTLAELDPQTRVKVLKPIEETDSSTFALATVVKETFMTLGEAAKMTTDQLADVVIEGVKQLRPYLPYIATLKERFKIEPRDSTNRLKHPIKGCHSWTEFCDKQLDRTPQAIGQALAKPKTPGIELSEREQFRRAAMKQAEETLVIQAPFLAYDTHPTANLFHDSMTFKLEFRNLTEEQYLQLHSQVTATAQTADDIHKAVREGVKKRLAEIQDRYNSAPVLEPQPDIPPATQTALRLQAVCTKLGMNVGIAPAHEIGKFNMTYRNLSEAELQQAIDDFKAAQQAALCS